MPWYSDGEAYPFQSAICALPAVRGHGVDDFEPVRSRLMWDLMVAGDMVINRNMLCGHDGVTAELWQGRPGGRAEA